MGLRNGLVALGLCVIVGGGQGCSSNGAQSQETDPSVPAPAQQSVDLSFCAVTETQSAGTLCAVQPSSLDPLTKDIASSANMADQTLGFGFHAIGIPSTYNPSKGLWIHFTGTYGRPYDQTALDFPSNVWLNEIMAQGYVVVQIAYDNRLSVNDSCKAPAPGYNRNNCAGEIRDEVLTGVSRSPYVSTDEHNSSDHRLQVLLAYLLTKANFPLPTSLDPANIDWSQIVVSGHSQGGNLAYYLAKNRGVKFSCMLGAPYDVPDSVSPGAVPIADWFSTGSVLTPVSNLGQLITKQDPYYSSFHAGAAYVGMTLGQQAFEADQAPYLNSQGTEIDGHAASVAAPALAGLRAQACFR